MNEKKNSSGRGVEAMCEDLEESDSEPLEAFSEWVRFAIVGDECYDASYASRIAVRSNTSWDQPGTLSGRKIIRNELNSPINLKLIGNV